MTLASADVGKAAIANPSTRMNTQTGFVRDAVIGHFSLLPRWKIGQLLGIGDHDLRLSIGITGWIQTGGSRNIHT